MIGIVIKILDIVFGEGNKRTMLQLERQKLILSYLEKNRKATTNELSDMLGVSATTIRTDLNQMDKEKLLTKTHGGALYLDRETDHHDLTTKFRIAVFPFSFSDNLLKSGLRFGSTAENAGRSADRCA